MKYKVKVAFKDIQDSLYQYSVGDEFPRAGVTVSKDRINELSTMRNKANMVLIEKVDEPKVEEPKVEEVVEEPIVETEEENKGFGYTKNEIMRMSVSKLKTIAEELGLDSSLSGNKLKPLIIEKMGL